VRFLLEFSYAGTNYHGWQSQPNAISVQGVMEKALSTILKSPTSLVAAGRTDTGVHARQMFAHFDSTIKSELQDKLVYLLNQFLPSDIVIQSLRQVKLNTHARFDALLRTYEYHINIGKSAFQNDLHYQFNQILDFNLMNTAAQILLEYEDFQCFSKSKTDVKTFLCKITHAEWIKKGDQLIFTIRANRFLRNMVRAIVGTLIEVGLAKKNIDHIHQIIQSKNRSLAGYSVPAEGLFLTQIDYPIRYI
jgi:tRNA pseudouridine38-40 synthase